MTKGLKVDTTFFLSGSQAKNVGNNWLNRQSRSVFSKLIMCFYVKKYKIP